MEWPYAELSKAAKAAGGPEKLVEKLVNSGKQEMYPWLGITFVAGSILTVTVQKITRYFKKKKAISKEEVEKAKSEIIQGINDYDAAQNINEEKE